MKKLGSREAGAMKRYSVIYADPPWRYRDKSKHRGGAERHYPTLSTMEIARLNVQAIASDDALLFLWTTAPFIANGSHWHVAQRWGFVLKTVAFTWVKVRTGGGGELVPAIGMGHWTRSNAEFCLLGVRGKPKRVARDVSSVVLSPRLEHSRKPDEVRDRIVRLAGDVPRIELFARQRVPGWDQWGNEIEQCGDLTQTLCFGR